ncbi:aspartate aminotransferase family protein [Aliarcobacter butzleri]|uniref:aspartate aminotransferase family protein n=1 Tax=Aliarcobacter butzleri TaxID=28197 RepID=UPI001EDBE416|nr:aspartate aminotransferase family protein [Aliarcobacter butzleri]MCG3675502.1 aspartate aminotransferase family protein [Aliarcobacter butzleri]MCT7592915.1 aspartate aminotransferase family protein [Aliarcobacter butzleri]MCT7639455.1 aspartate aminotransferase family protein [Aliarcobacter butzleri]MDN5094498.1 aspartate aminotransferase family protein [Aliarcobacter butzleri]MDN5094541.1 aspartate aminotransferase family protein [Aliarcobacter butzleri]
MENLEQMDKEYVLHTYARNYVNFKKGINATLFDDNNKDYIDFTSGIGVVSVGHGNKQVAQKIFEQASNLTHTSNLYAIEPQAKLAKKIRELSGYDVRTFFSNSGAEANEGAIKIARTYGETQFENKKYKIITLENSFHGRTITTVKATGQSSFHQNKFAPYPEGFSFNAIDDVYNAIDDETVAVMIELVQGEGGVFPFPKDKIQELAKFLKDNNILLIVDEVQTGIFRTGEFLASNLYEIEPDIITLAKGLGGGVPIGAVLTTHKDIWGAGDHGSTFGGNYLVTSTGLEVLNILEELKDSGRLDETIIHFTKKLDELYEKNKDIFITHVGLGLMRGLRVKDGDTLALLIKTAFDCGVMVLKSGNNTLRFLPPLTISKTEIDEGFKRLQTALDKIKK